MPSSLRSDVGLGQGPCCTVLEASSSPQSCWQSIRDTMTLTAQRAGSITGQGDGAGRVIGAAGCSYMASGKELSEL